MACNSINSTLEFFTIVLMVVLFISIMFKKRKKTDLDRLFLLTLILHAVNTAGDLAAWRFTCKPGAFALIVTTTGNFLTYFVSAAAYLCFFVYVYQDAAGDLKLPVWGKWLFGIIDALCLFLMVLPVFNFRSGILYTIDADNTFTWGSLSSLPDNLVLVQILLLFPILLYVGWKRQKSVATSFLYLALPAMGALLENWSPYLMLLYPSFGISLLLIYIVLQQEQEKQLIEKEQELSDSRIKVMVSQIQPHFLYNTLNSIYHLCEKDSGMAQQAISDFSDYLRMNLKSLDHTDPIPFKEELRHVKTYLHLEKMRFEEDLRVEYDIGADDFMLPALTIQPLVENAVKHGIIPKKGGGTVTLATREESDCYRIIIADDGVGFVPGIKKEDGKSHVGIRNVRQRLREMCRAELDIESALGKGTKTTITLPKEQQNEPDTDRK